MRRARRDPDWSKLAFVAQKRRGTGGLQVLQDAIMSDPKLGPLFDRAQAKADRLAYKKASPYCVVFCMGIMRGHLKAQRPLPTKPRWWKDEPGGQHETQPWEGSYSASAESQASHRAFVDKQGWPFSVLARSRLHTVRIGIQCTLVYDSHLKLNAHSLQTIQARFKAGGPEAPMRRVRDRARRTRRKYTRRQR